jgi:DNA-directed RNA polymerase specialized sigma24 family protein
LLAIERFQGVLAHWMTRGARPFPRKAAETAPRARASNCIVMLRRILEKRIDALPDDKRAVFALRALGELSVEETAATLAIAEATVRTRYFRACGLLREALGGDIDRTLEEVFAIEGERCDRLVARVLESIAAGT